MPISISSPSRNLFLLGSVGGEVITNFFRTVDKYDTAVNPNPQDYTYGPTEIRYNFADQKFLLAGTKISGQSDKYEGWIEKRTGANAVPGLDNQLDTEIGIGGSDDVQLLCMELDNSNNILAAGRVGDVPFVARYSNAGGLQWQSTTNSAEVIYTGLTVDSNDNIYAAGSLVEYNGNTHAFIEKFDSNGNPGWGKSAYFLGNICGVRKIAANSRGEVIAVGTLDDDDHTRGYIVKLDTATGEVKWDKTLESSEGMPQTAGLRSINCEDVFIDTNDQIYIVGRGRGFSSNIGFIIKMTAEGNIIWQRQTPVDHDIAFWNVKSDGETEQTIVLGDYRDTSGKQYGLLSKYAKNGDLVWRRVIYSSYNNGDYYGNRVPSRYGGGVNLDADPSFYYLLSSDEQWNIGNSTPKSFHFGKVSTSGNGLGNFEYDEGSGETIFYEIEPIEDEIGRLDDNSVRNDSSDFITYPFSPTKILFDDLATRVDNKKRHSDSLGFQYSGSPAIRPADFQELNLLGDVISTNESTVQVSSEIKTTSTDGAAGDRLRKVAVGNDRIIGGAPLDDDNGNNSGSAYIFDLNGNQLSKITASDGASNDFFGDAVAVGSNKIVVGAYSAQVGSNSTQGAAYIYDLDGTNEIKITASDGAPGDRFGSAVAMGPNQIVVTAPFTDAIYIFDLTGNQLSKITNTGLGSSVAVGSNKIVVGASGNDTIANNAGAVYTYDLDGTNESIIYAPDGADSDFFGHRVAVGNDKIVVSSDSAGGSAYIFDLNGNQLNKILASDGIAGDFFGHTVAVGNDRVVINSPNNGIQQGAIYIYPIVYSAIDQSGKGNDGLVNGATQNAAGYWEFDGTDDNIAIDYNSSGKINFSIESWFYFDTLPTLDTSKGYIWDQSPGASGVAFRASTAGDLTTFAYPTSGIGVVLTNSGVTLETERWYHAVSVFEPDKVTLYVDGVFANGAATMQFGFQAVEDVGNTDFFVGCAADSGGSEFMDGRIGEVRIYDRSLSAAQVFQNYNATKSKYLNEAPDTAPKIGPGIVYDSNLILNYDFGNRATYNPAENLLPDTIDLKNDWTSGPDGPIETSDVASPIGTYDVFKVTTSATDQNAIVYEAIDTLTTQLFDYTFSFWVKSVDGSSGTWGVNYFANGHNRTTVPITGEWTRVSFTFTAGTGGENIYIGDNRSDLASINEAYVWGPQLNKGGVMEPYVRTYGSAITAPTTVKNLSSTSFPGTINGATFNPAGYFEFDGTNDYIQSSSVMAPGTTDFSVVFWYKITSTSGRGGLFERAASSPFSGWVLGQGGDLNWSAAVRDSSNNNVAFQYTFPTVDQWTCDAFTWDVSTQTLTPYRNGANAGTATNTGTVGSLDGNTRYPMAIGGRLDSASPQYKPMECGEVQMYSRVLTAAEVLQNFNATRSKYGV